MGLKHPSLAYLFRFVLARRMIDDLPGGRFLEVGVGRGRFYLELARQGFWGKCLDLNPGLIQMHQQQPSPAIEGIQFLNINFEQIPDRFDLIVAFEVLEHYLDDLSCLKEWRLRLEPEGRLIFSVPAHMRQWTINDDLAGHVRRYEKEVLLEKIKAAELEVETLWCYGYPILNWTYRFSSSLKKAGPARRCIDRECSKEQTRDGLHMFSAEKTAASGNFAFGSRLESLFQEFLWRPFLTWQQRSLAQDWGVGYLVRCRAAGPGKGIGGTPFSAGEPDPPLSKI
jgi:2-polyprenyl-3-methyl-5-hydroxy-6-metoxy-1,4-benzoquinol methylase